MEALRHHNDNRQAEQQQTGATVISRPEMKTFKNEYSARTVRKYMKEIAELITWFLLTPGYKERLVHRDLLSELEAVKTPSKILQIQDKEEREKKFQEHTLFIVYGKVKHCFVLLCMGRYPEKRLLNLENLAVEDFDAYLCSKRKERVRQYKESCSALSFLFKRYNYQISFDKITYFI